MSTLVVSGTDTGVGKTVVTAAVACCARLAGIDVAVCKPVQTGSPADDDLADIARNSSAWVRATAPGGSADYVGKVGWSGELGFGVKDPELGQTAPPEVPEADAGHGGGH